ncbi:MAG: hypothetical protein ABTD50_18245 [Polyangiaceae bacterium]|jgi:hypothetical protein
MHGKILLLLATTMFTPACVWSTGTSDAGAGAECQADVTFQAGDRVEGLDPMAWIAQYWGSYQGTLVWSAGGQTTIELTTAQDTGEPVTGQCAGGKVVAIYTYGHAVFTSADGTLSVTYDTIIGGPLPDSPTTSSTAFQVTGIPISAQSPVASHMTIDFSRYSTQSNLSLFFDWPVDTAKPVSAELTFEGYPLQATGVIDYILVASITFP